MYFFIDTIRNAVYIKDKNKTQKGNIMTKRKPVDFSKPPVKGGK